MPRRYFDYPARFQTLHVISTVGSWLLGPGMLLAIVHLVWSAFRGKRAEANPWDSLSYEWRTASPPPPANFDAPLATEPGPYEYAALLEQPERAAS
jgi:cytochrome c oxidase subunit 1